jgi:hypothetical protein
MSAVRSLSGVNRTLGGQPNSVANNPSGTHVVVWWRQGIDPKNFVQALGGDLNRRIRHKWNAFAACGTRHEFFDCGFEVLGFLMCAPSIFVEVKLE